MNWKGHIKQFLKRQVKSNFATNILLDDNTFDVTKLPIGYFKSFGNKNSDKIFYVIWLNNKGFGFFSNLSAVLCHLKIANDLGMIPVIDFQNFKTFYNEKGAINNNENAWEYYFKPVSPFLLDEVYESKNVFFCSGNYPASMSYCITQINGIFEEIYLKKIFLQNHVKEILKRHLVKFNDRILGVHFRGQEMKLATGHSFPPTEQQMIRYTNEIIVKYNIDKIFIVTEDQDYLNLFIEKFGDKVLYTNSFRTHKVNAYHIYPRDNHRYLLGLDVLIDAFLLSECTGILCGDSNVSEFARFVNNKRFEFTYFINNGVNSSNSFIAKYLYRLKIRLPSHFGGLADKIQIS